MSVGIPPTTRIDSFVVSVYLLIFECKNTYPNFKIEERRERRGSGSTPELHKFNKTGKSFSTKTGLDLFPAYSNNTFR